MEVIIVKTCAFNTPPFCIVPAPAPAPIPVPTPRASTNESLATGSARLTPTKYLRMRLDDAEKIILLQEIIASKAHIATLGSVQKKFHQAAKVMNSHSNVRFDIKGRAFQEKFISMLREFRKEDNRDRLHSGTGSELSEMD